ncbi:4Fe-4S ferredoxin iron-sulfur binding domain protein [Candidatus Vecturithrix granuli]|uniref:4Fe-4S ferredoxin iron-sulfur binding domain protein n=1 Tax=Vecturithrix granuli TaxID=1499967 RepID=A0A081CA46_VECG1|nr:4Fe-4S ferredoxin iron-sulfur binding domain protein [Candidatus Vecturithrix granuli]
MPCLLLFRMAHHTIKSSYAKLVARLNQFPQGATPSDLLYKILAMLFSEQEAELVAALPIKSFTAETASKRWKHDLATTQKMLDELASRAILLDTEQQGQTIYTLPPPMAGFFEFSLMRVRQDIDQQLLSELFYQYLNVEEDFIKALFTDGETQLGRVFVQEAVLTNDQALHVLDYERATEVIKTASHIAVGVCYCRHKMQHLGRACQAPMEICMTFGTVASSLIRHDVARQVDVAEGLDLLHTAYDYNLVQFGENVRKEVSFICNCCGCCCEAMIAARRFGMLHPVHTTNFLPQVKRKTCTGCGKCVVICPAEAMTLISANDPHHPNKKIAKVNEDLCLGCGVCVKPCPTNSIRLESRPQRVLTPLNTTHRAVVMAIERGMLQNLIFDNQALLSHRAMAAILGVILKLPPIKQAMASKQMKSRYLETLITRLKI